MAVVAATAATAVMGSLTVPSGRPAPLSTSQSAATLASAAVISPLDRRLPHFAGLRALAIAPRTSLVRTQGSRRRAVAVVSEAQGTALLLPDVDKSTWQSLVLDSDTPVLVDFWAPWCGPCRMIEPTILNLAEVYAGKLKCYKLNTDENADIASQYSIRSIPTVMIFKNGEKKETVIGAVPESTLISSIEKFV